jgi:hypothetical protein
MPGRAYTTLRIQESWGTYAENICAPTVRLFLQRRMLFLHRAHNGGTPLRPDAGGATLLQYGSMA